MSIYRWVRAAWGIALRHPVDILVYQMGKVGSTSVCRSLQKAGFGPLQVHRTVSDLPHMERFTETDRDFPFHFYLGRLLRRYFKWTSHRIKIITLVRDPIARYISAQFQTLDHEPIPTEDAQQAARQLQQTVGKRREEISFAWFGREMEPQLGVNPISEPFDREAGYALIEAPRADVLVLKLEQLDDLIPGVVSAFVGEELRVVRANRGEEKEYADYYQEVLRHFSVSETVCREVYNHKHIRHFYTPDEINQFVQKWTDQSTVPHT